MKIRMRRNSIRLRLSQSEIAAISRRQSVRETVAFGPRAQDQFHYELVPSEPAAKISAAFDGRTITVVVPWQLAESWAKSDQVGLETEQNALQDQTLSLLIEKDFACLKPRANEDDSDAFPNPMVTCE